MNHMKIQDLPCKQEQFLKFVQELLWLKLVLSSSQDVDMNPWLASSSLIIVPQLWVFSLVSLFCVCTHTTWKLSKQNTSIHSRTITKKIYKAPEFAVHRLQLRWIKSDLFFLMLTSWWVWAVFRRKMLTEERNCIQVCTVLGVTAESQLPLFCNSEWCFFLGWEEVGYREVSALLFRNQWEGQQLPVAAWVGFLPCISACMLEWGGLGNSCT